MTDIIERGRPEWYREAYGNDFDAAPPCPNTDDGKHRLNVTGMWCVDCGLRGLIKVDHPGFQGDP